jgi:tetratricopeptide (TPR) repeat protein
MVRFSALFSVACGLAVCLSTPGLAQTSRLEAAPVQIRPAPGEKPGVVRPSRPNRQNKAARKKPAGKPFSRKALIEPLLDKLAQTKDAETAKAIADAIQKLWIRSGSPTVDLLMSQAAAAMSKKDTSKALALLDAVVEISPDYAEGWNRRATLLYGRKSFDASISDISRVLELQPRHFGALTGLGLVLRDLGDKKSALAAFRRALAVHPFMDGPLKAVKQLETEVEGQGI